MAQLVKNLPAVWETWVRSQGKIPLDEGKGNPLQYKKFFMSYSLGLSAIGKQLSACIFHEKAKIGILLK